MSDDTEQRLDELTQRVLALETAAHKDCVSAAEYSEIDLRCTLALQAEDRWHKWALALAQKLHCKIDGQGDGEAIRRAIDKGLGMS